MLKINCLDNEYTNKTEKDRELGEVLIYFC
jgi:hypothetical protein